MLKQKNTQWRHTGVIFCGGKSSRMGRPKTGITLPNGLTGIEHIYQVLLSVCSDVILVGDAKYIPCSLSHVPQLSDRFENIGPMGGLDALLASGMDEEYLVVSCDLYWLSPKVLRLLTESAQTGPLAIQYQNKIEPLIARYPASLFPAVKQQIEKKDYSLQSLLASVECATIDLPEELSGFVRNANSPEDLIFG